MPLYWLDADVFIQASRKHYPLHRVPGFWAFLAAQLESGIIKCPRLVYEELVAGKIELSNWCKQRREKGLCVFPNKEVQASYTKISNHVASRYSLRHVADFLRGGDGWVIAHAMAGAGIVVTQEAMRGSYKSKIKVPNVCKGLDVKCIDTFQMLDALNAKL